MSNLLDAVHGLEGYLDPDETALLYSLAAQCPPGSCIVEIGSYRGKSTIALGLGAKEAGAQVWAIDPFFEVTETAYTQYGMNCHAALLENLTVFGLANIVRVVAMASYEVSLGWKLNHRAINLLWIDGSHDYADVRQDFEQWSPFVAPDGTIAMHDSSGKFESVSRFIDEMLAVGEWERVDLQDATSVFKRVLK